MSKKSLAAAVFALASLLAGTVPSTAADKGAPLSAEHRQWLEEVAPLISRQEKAAFLALAKDYQRDAFIKKWWQARDPYPETPENEFQRKWMSRVDEARRRYGNVTEDRARILLLHGGADSETRTDCRTVLWPIEIWYYEHAERLGNGFYFLFVQNGGGGPYRIWRSVDGYHALQATGQSTDAMVANSERDFFGTLFTNCPELRRVIERAVISIRGEESLGALQIVEAPPPPRDTEWLQTFVTFSTDLPKAARPLAATLDLAFPGRDGNRTLLQAVLQVPAKAAAAAHVEGREAGETAYNFILTGEVLKGEELFESFRYRFDVPARNLAADAVPLAFQRSLRPGSYTLVLKLEDLNGGGLFRESRPIAVPEVAAEGFDRAAAGELVEAREELKAGAPTLHLAAPAADVQTGQLRVEAVAKGDGIQRVSFYLDGKALLTKNRPPYSIDLALGALPVPRTLRAVALDAQGREVAADELTLNAPAQRFSVRLLEPRRGQRLPAGTRKATARAEVRVPDGQTLDRVEIYLGERRVATLYQPPFVQPLTLAAGDGAAYVRAVAVLSDGTTAEDLVLWNSPGYSENVDVQLVEVYAAVRDAAGRPVTDLVQGDFRIKDGGALQQVVRFERVTDLAVNTVFLLDTSASMARSLPQAQRAALEFLKTLEPRDRAAVIGFNDSPRLAVKLTNDLPILAGALAGLQAERGTALFDSLVFALHYLSGVRGQRALLLLTDGGDRSSRFTFDEALEFARRSGVAIYAIGLGIPKVDLANRAHLARLADETGGRSWFAGDAAELSGIYGRIQEELRSRYLLAYQPSSPPKPGEFRPVEVEVDRSGVTVEAIRGYYP
ncbi:MAG TPA: VWA domain-containing protein [Thermoanaerobaculia bacterium]|nr:VWA domain-containing protein [Thermoanaerobaculia bacterium]